MEINGNVIFNNSTAVVQYSGPDASGTLEDGLITLINGEEGEGENNNNSMIFVPTIDLANSFELEYRYTTPSDITDTHGVTFWFTGGPAIEGNSGVNIGISLWYNAYLERDGLNFSFKDNGSAYSIPEYFYDNTYNIGMEAETEYLVKISWDATTNTLSSSIPLLDVEKSRVIDFPIEGLFENTEMQMSHTSHAGTSTFTFNDDDFFIEGYDPSLWPATPEHTEIQDHTGAHALFYLKDEETGEYNLLETIGAEVSGVGAANHQVVRLKEDEDGGYNITIGIKLSQDPGRSVDYLEAYGGVNAGYGFDHAPDFTFDSNNWDVMQDKVLAPGDGNSTVTEDEVGVDKYIYRLIEVLRNEYWEDTDGDGVDDQWNVPVTGFTSALEVCVLEFEDSVTYVDSDLNEFTETNQDLLVTKICQPNAHGVLNSLDTGNLSAKRVETDYVYLEDSYDNDYSWTDNEGNVHESSFGHNYNSSVSTTAFSSNYNSNSSNTETDADGVQVGNRNQYSNRNLYAYDGGISMSSGFNNNYSGDRVIDGLTSNYGYSHVNMSIIGNKDYSGINLSGSAFGNEYVDGNMDSHNSASTKIILTSEPNSEGLTKRFAIGVDYDGNLTTEEA